jgi:hypothetical protein
MNGISVGVAAGSVVYIVAEYNSTALLPASGTMNSDYHSYPLDTAVDSVSTTYIAVQFLQPLFGRQAYLRYSDQGRTRD